MEDNPRISVGMEDDEGISGVRPENAKVDRCHSVDTALNEKTNGPVAGRAGNLSIQALLPRCNSDASANRLKEKRDPSQFRPSKPLTEFSGFITERVAVHKTGFIFKKVQRSEITLSYTKGGMKQALTLSAKPLKKDAVNLFRQVQCYMGDRKPKIQEPIEIALQISILSYNHKQLRDELFMQISKQMTNNPSRESFIKGWELFVIMLSIYPPSHLFSEYLETFLGQHIKVEENLSPEDLEINTFASFCVQKLRRMVQTGVKRGTEPKLEEVRHALNSVKNPSVFGCTISDVLSLQAEDYPAMYLPWFLRVLADMIVDLGGMSTEGIFRVPGDVDEVNALKLLLDKNEASKSKTKDPGVPGSLLKLWFRDLYEPLIPAEFYDRCLENSTDIGECIEIVDQLPQDNKLVVYFIINFLQKFAVEEHAKVTLMTTENLAMVWAPNFVRCPSSDPLKILEMNKREKAFVTTLIQHLNTKDIENLK